MKKNHCIAAVFAALLVTLSLGTGAATCRTAYTRNGAKTVCTLTYDDIVRYLSSVGVRITSQSAKPVESKPTENQKPTETPKPTEEKKPSEEAKPTQPTKPVEDTKPTAPSVPADSHFSATVAEIHRLVNAERAAAGLKAVTLDSDLCRAAAVRAGEAVRAFSHTRPNGQSCFTVLKELGISYGGAGENIAYGQSSAEEVMRAWMNSSGHRANILGAGFTKLGVGVVQSGGTMYYAQMFTY